MQATEITPLILSQDKTPSKAGAGEIDEEIIY
jgi:hypothetical protein